LNLADTSDRSTLALFAHAFLSSRPHVFGSPRVDIPRLGSKGFLFSAYERSLSLCQFLHGSAPLRRSFTLGIVLLFGSSAFAQDYPRIEVPLGYSYMRFNPENSDTLKSFSQNGGVEGVVVNVTHAFGIQAEFNGYAGETRNFCIPAGTICPTGCGGSVQADLFTYNVGPVFKYRTEYFEPFFETMFGGATPMPAPISLKGLRRLLRNLRGANQQRFRFHYGGRCGHSMTKSIAIRYWVYRRHPKSEQLPLAGRHFVFRF